MDGAQKPTDTFDKPGAPELSRSVSVPVSAPLNDEPQAGPAFQPTPTASAAARPPIEEDFDDDVQPYASPKDEHKAQADYLRNLRESAPDDSHKLRNTILITLLILVVLALAAGAYWWWGGPLPGDNQKQQPVATTTPQTTNQQAQQSASEDAATTKTEDYSSVSLGLSLAYPSSWTPAETNGVLTITSPVVDLTDATGQKQKGEIVLTVRNKQALLPEFDAGSAVAVLASEKIKYTKPSSIQRASTYVSYLQYAATTTKGGLDGIYITGDAGYQYAQTILKGDIARIDPKISVGFVSCGDGACAKGSPTKPLTITNTSWTGPNKEAVMAMLASIVLQ
jgi:hypothetical protein